MARSLLGSNRSYVLDTCLDTAPFGDEAAWNHPPTSGAVVDEWMHGRGSAANSESIDLVIM